MHDQTPNGRSLERPFFISGIQRKDNCMTTAHEQQTGRPLPGVTIEGAFTVAAAVRAQRDVGHEVLDLSIGEPGFPTPPHIVDAAVRALDAGDTRYAAPAGLIDLRAAVADSCTGSGPRTSAEQVVITPGAKPALLYALLALVEAGDEVLLPDPGFPPYAAMTHIAGATPITYPVSTGFDADAVAARVTPRTRVIIVNSPHNPTGAALSSGDLEAVARLAADHNLWIISDEIYARLWYGPGQRAPGIGAVAPIGARAVVVDGFSKSYSMTGWRLGYCVAPVALATVITRIAVNAHSCVAPFVQRAGIAALRGPDPVPAFVAELRARRDLLVGGLNDIHGIRCTAPAGAFYALADIGGVLEGAGVSGDELTDILLNNYSVAAVPGSVFGNSVQQTIRFSFAAPTEVIRSALGRIATACDAVSRLNRSAA